jgi:hypothetical protein
MKITEIIVSDEAKLFEYIKSYQIAHDSYLLFDSIKSVTSNFVYEHYEVFSQGDTFDIINELDYLRIEASRIFRDDEQVVEVLNFLANYFAR